MKILDQVAKETLALSEKQDKATLQNMTFDNYQDNQFQLVDWAKELAQGYLDLLAEMEKVKQSNNFGEIHHKTIRGKLKEEITQLKSDRAKLIEALKFYADEKHDDSQVSIDREPYTVEYQGRPLELTRSGKTARAVLAELGES